MSIVMTSDPPPCSRARDPGSSRTKAAIPVPPRPGRWRLAPCRAIWLALGAGGCSAAPSQDVLGSFFPAWMLCAVAGVAAAVLGRWLLVTAGLGEHLLAPPLVYLAIGVAATLLAWLTWFGG